jgi:integrase
MRAGELGGLRWDDIDFEKRLICVQRCYVGPTKSGELRWVPILDPLLPVLRAWRLRNPLPIVFPNRDSRPLGPSARVFQEVFHRVLDRAGFPRTPGRRTRGGYIRFHDLRHTFASHWVMNEGDLFKLEKILGHHHGTMTRRYAHLAPAAFAADFKRLGEHAPVEMAVVLPLRAADAGQPASVARLNCG